MSERTYIPSLRHISFTITFTISKNSRSTKLISRHSVARYELVDLLFFNSAAGLPRVPRDFFNGKGVPWLEKG